MLSDVWICLIVKLFPYNKGKTSRKHHFFFFESLDLSESLVGEGEGMPTGCLLTGLSGDDRSMTFLFEAERLRPFRLEDVSIPFSPPNL